MATLCPLGNPLPACMATEYVATTVGDDVVEVLMPFPGTVAFRKEGTEVIADDDRIVGMVTESAVVEVLWVVISTELEFGPEL